MNLPNKITVGRIFATFIFLLFANAERFVNFVNNIGSEIGTEPISFSDNHYYYIHLIGFILAAIAGFSDILDGYLARKYNLVTDFGKLMDPLADKILVASVFITMIEVPEVKMPAWIVIIIVCREFLVTGLRLLAVSKGDVISSDNFGKIKTILQMSILGFCGLLWFKVVELASCHIALQCLWHLSLWATVLITVWSGYGYFKRNKHLYSDA